MVESVDCYRWRNLHQRFMASGLCSHPEWVTKRRSDLHDYFTKVNQFSWQFSDHKVTRHCGTVLVKIISLCVQSGFIKEREKSFQINEALKVLLSLTTVYWFQICCSAPYKHKHQVT